MNRFFSYLMRCAMGILVLIIYLLAWRPVRSAITEKVIYPQLATATRVKLYTIKRDGVSLRISFPWNGHTKTIQYRPQAGFFFLNAVITLLFVTFRFKWYLVLVAFHVVATLLTAALMLLSKDGWYPGFIFVDLVVTYLVPGITLALAVWAVAQRNKKALLLKD